jgi:hypothetical protein
MKHIIFCGFLFVLISCNSEKSTPVTVESAVSEAQSLAENCQYQYNPAQTAIQWIAFKTPKKVGVSGRFEKFELKLDKNSSQDLKEILSTASVEIDTTSVATGDKGRDAKIVKHFFNDGIALSAKVIKIDEASLVMRLKMNEKEQDVEMSYRFINGKLEANGSIDVLAFAMDSFLEAINKACYALHEGKTWSDVKITLISQFEQTCLE